MANFLKGEAMFMQELLELSGGAFVDSMWDGFKAGVLEIGKEYTPREEAIAKHAFFVASMTAAHLFTRLLPTLTKAEQDLIKTTIIHEMAELTENLTVLQAKHHYRQNPRGG